MHGHAHIHTCIHVCVSVNMCVCVKLTAANQYSGVFSIQFCNILTSTLIMINSSVNYLGSVASCVFGIIQGSSKEYMVRAWRSIWSHSDSDVQWRPHQVPSHPTILSRPILLATFSNFNKECQLRTQPWPGGEPEPLAQQCSLLITMPPLSPPESLDCELHTTVPAYIEWWMIRDNNVILNRS